MINTLSNIIQNVQSQSEQQNEKFKKALLELIPELNKEIDTLDKECVDAIYLDTKSMDPEKMPEIIKALDSKLERFRKLDETSKRYNEWQIVLGVPQQIWDNLDELNKNLINRHLMWHSLEEWQAITDGSKKT